MLLRLCCPAPSPTICFTLTFSDLPRPLPLPLAWAQAADALATHGLPAPPSAHALDRTTRAIVLLERVSFNMLTERITCTWLDETVSEFPLSAMCLSALESVVNDANLGVIETQRETERSLRRPSPADYPPTPPTSLSKGSKLKRSRSAFFSLVASFLSSERDHQPPAHPAPDTTLSPAPPPPLLDHCGRPLTSRFYRRRARSVLVDAFRRFVIPQINNAPQCSAFKAGYDVWVTSSLLRQMHTQMRLILDNAAPLAQTAGFCAAESPATPRSSDDLDFVPGWPYGAPDDEDSVTSDDSSIDTPLEGEPLGHGLQSEDTIVRARKPSLPRWMTPPSSPSSPPEQQEDAAPPPTDPCRAVSMLADLGTTYRMFQSNASRLSVLRSYMRAQHSRIQGEEKALSLALENRSLRRAFSCGARLSRSSCPLRRSPLATCPPITPEDLEADDDDEELSFNECFELSPIQKPSFIPRLKMRRTRSAWSLHARVVTGLVSIPTIEFPLVEDDERTLVDHDMPSEEDEFFARRQMDDDEVRFAFTCPTSEQDSSPWMDESALPRRRVLSFEHDIERPSTPTPPALMRSRMSLEEHEDVDDARPFCVAARTEDDDVRVVPRVAVAVKDDSRTFRIAARRKFLSFSRSIRGRGDKEDRKPLRRLFSFRDREVNVVGDSGMHVVFAESDLGS